jgi:hypothetical protein
MLKEKTLELYSLKMNTEMLIKLLQIHFEHKRKIDEFKGKINLAYLEIDLLSLVLDAVGVPADNAITQIEKYGYSDWLNQPDTFSRYGYYLVFEKQVVHGTAEECQTYLEAVRATIPAYFLLDLRLMAMEKMSLGALLPEA